MAEYSFLRLHNGLEAMVRMLGLERATDLVESYSSMRAKEKNVAVDLSKFIASHVIPIAISTYGLDEKRFHHIQETEACEARMICYHLIRKYAGCSYRKVAENFPGKSERRIKYATYQVNQMLLLTTGYKEFNDRYKLIEKQLIEHIGDSEKEKSDEDRAGKDC